MRITLIHTDFDVVSKEKWFFVSEGFLVDPHIAMSRDKMGISFYYFVNAVEEGVDSVGTLDAKIFKFEIGNRVENIDIEELADMSLSNLGKLIAAQI